VRWSARDLEGEAGDMAANIYVGQGRSGAPPLPVDTNNSDVALMSTPVPVGNSLRACDTRVKVRNSGNAAASCVLHLCYIANYLTAPVLVECTHNGVPSITAAQNVAGGSAPVAFRVTGDIPTATTPLVGVIYVDGKFNNQSTPPAQNPVCGEKIV
jgi:hypothetical protein